MEVNQDERYYQGYMAGYWDGVSDTLNNRSVMPVSGDLMTLPIKAMNVSTRARNCLSGSGCKNITDVASLSEQTIMTMRNLGTKTASEIAQWLLAHGIHCSAWTKYL